MATINTIQDLIRLLRENEEWRNAVRRELLTEELLELPQRFAEYTAANDKRWDDLDEWRGGVDKKLDSLQADVGSLRISVDSLRGTTLETKMYTKLAPLVAREFDVKRVRRILSPGTDYLAIAGYRSEFIGKVEEAAEDGVISEEDETRIQVTDLIMRSLRKSDGSVLWFAIEASGVINDDDITRAKLSAHIITKVYEQGRHASGVWLSDSQPAAEVGRRVESLGLPRPRQRLERHRFPLCSSVRQSARGFHGRRIPVCPFPNLAVPRPT